MLTADNNSNEIYTVRIDDFSSNLHIGSSSVIGKRKYQQDCIKTDDFYNYAENKSAIAVLCDGMGGMNGGELASECCASIVHKSFHEEEFNSVLDFYKEVIALADEAVKYLKDEKGNPVSNSGTTMVSVVIEDDELYWASVGDSRVYIVRNNDILAVTKDHNLLMLLMTKVERGEITLEEAENDPKKEALTSYIGMGGVRFVDSNSKGVKLLDGDIIVLCSDGLYRALADAEIRDIVVSCGKETQTAADSLTRFAVDKGIPTQDNTSVVVIYYDAGR